MATGATPGAPSLDVLLGRSASTGWALIGIERLSCYEPQRWTAAADLRARVTPWGLRFDGELLQTDDPSMHFYVPITKLPMTMEMACGVLSVSLPSTTSATTAPPAATDSGGYSSEMTSPSECSFDSSFRTVIYRQRFSWRDWRLEDYDVGEATGYIAAGDSMRARAAALNAAGIEAVDAWTPVFQPSDWLSAFAYLSYQFSQIRYLLGGLTADSAGEPVSGLWRQVESRSFDSKRLAHGPGADTTSVIGNAYAQEAMRNLGPRLQSNDNFRRNELGTQILNGEMWPEKPNHAIALADNALDHGRLRPLLDRLVGPAAAVSSMVERAIEEAARSFWSDATVAVDANVFTQTILHKALLNVSVSSTMARDFAGKKQELLVMAGGPPAAVCLLVDCEGLRAWKAARLVEYRTALSRVVPAEWQALSDLEKTKVASAVLDALLFAGGVSVPSVVSNAFAVLYGEYGRGQLGEGFELREEQLLPFAFEVIRRFPPVAGFASWDRRTNQHVLIDLLMASLDERGDGWGPSAREFRLRPMAEYHKKGVAWADQATVAGDNAHPFTRACPAKDLSIRMVVGFLRTFLRRGGQRCWRSTQRPSEIEINGYGSTTVALRHVC